MAKQHLMLATITVLALGVLTGCRREVPVAMAPPVSAPPPAAQSNGEVYQWQDVPKGQEIAITRAVFDQGGYQLYASTGETIVVPFANQNMYVMKFGKSENGGMYFVSDGSTPTLYVPNGAGLENAAAQGAKWYPFPQNYAYTRPVYMGLAPTWSDYVAMSWYPGMLYYGGYYGYRPWVPGLFYSPMVGLNINIGGRPYYGWNSYSTYYRSNPIGRVGWSSRPSYNYNSVGRRTGSSSFGSASGSRGSFGGAGGRSSFGGGGTRTGGGSFGSSSARTPFGGGSARTSGGSFGSTRSSFGGGTAGTSSSSGFGPSRTGRTGSFGAGASSSGFGSTRAPFGGGASSSGSTRSSGGFFGGGSSGTRSSGGGFFGGGSSSTRSSGGGFFGGGSSTRSSGGGFFGGGSSGRRSGGFGGFGGRRR